MSLLEFTAAQTAADAREHPCPATPDIDEPIAVAGHPARFTVKDCGLFIGMTAVVHDGVGYVFHFQHPPTAAAGDDDIAAFKELLGGVRLP